MSFSYKGNIEPADVYQHMEREGATALLLDVRTQAEHTFVGFPRLSDMSRYCLLEWMHYPAMSPNTAFIEQCITLLSRQPDPVTDVFIICRSGQRSHAAGIALEQQQAQPTEELAQSVTFYNVAGGFEGDRDPQAGQRSTHNGWKFAGLPWQQN